MSDRIVRAVLSGSFRKDIEGLKNAYDELVACGCQILSPHRLSFDNTGVLFVRDQAEESVTEEFLERHHLLGIRQADFLWIHTREGYIGKSTAFEAGYAVASHTPIFCSCKIDEPGLAPFIQVVPSVYAAIKEIQGKRAGQPYEKL